MKNEFQKLVDRELSGLCWNERMRCRVLCSMEKEDKPVKKKMTAAMVMAMILVLVGSLALAAGLMFSPRYDALKAADDALLNAYGITDELLPFFVREMDEENGVVTYSGMEELLDVVGCYTVNAAHERSTVTWSLDGIKGAWNAEKLEEANEITKQPNGYSKVIENARADAEKYQLNGTTSSKTQILTEEEFRAVRERQDEERELVKQAAQKTVSEMDQLGRAAVRERFGLTDSQAAIMNLEEDSCEWYIKNERKLFSLYYWLWQSGENWVEGNGIYIVDINVETGAVEEIFYDNGLLGNG